MLQTNSLILHELPIKRLKIILCFVIDTTGIDFWTVFGGPRHDEKLRVFTYHAGFYCSLTVYVGTPIFFMIKLMFPLVLHERSYLHYTG
jgi:hypothetical protein